MVTTLIPVEAPAGVVHNAVNSESHVEGSHGVPSMVMTTLFDVVPKFVPVRTMLVPPTSGPEVMSKEVIVGPAL